MRKKFQKRKSTASDRPLQAGARRKAMDALARRNLSKVELRNKLELQEFTSAEIEDAIEFAEQNRWISPPHELAKQVLSALSRKKKSARYIDHFLRDKGLPTPEVDPEAELEKALDIVQSKLSKESGFDLEEKQKVQRLLTNRGFDSTTIRKVLERK